MREGSTGLVLMIRLGITVRMSGDAQVSQIACSQQGNRKALTASLLQMAHLSLMGMSSGAIELAGS